MEHAAKLKPGDYVRIMQTDEMVQRGLQNQCGEIVNLFAGEHILLTEDRAQVSTRQGLHIVPLTCLMKESRRII